MKIKVNNLYQHADDGYYCLLVPEAPMKQDHDGEWVPGVIYTGIDGLTRSSSRARWDERFSPVAEYTGDDELVIDMIRRANPGDSDFDFMRVFESWHESEMGITGHMLELAVGAAMERYKVIEADGSQRLTITTEDLQRVLQNYEIERVPEAHGFTFIMRKSFPNEG